jgi:NAD-dependent deacetylase sirtuin 2
MWSFLYTASSSIHWVLGGTAVVLTGSVVIKRSLSQMYWIKANRPTLQSKSLKGIADLIANPNCKNIIVISGAGISVNAGIPDFRSEKSGLYCNLAKYNLPYPEAMFDISYFMRDPKPFFSLAKNLIPADAKPTVTHHFLKLLEDKKKLLRNYTQNIDNLERIAGMTDDKLVEAHGSVNSATCLKCKIKFKYEYIKEKIIKEEIPICACGGIIKPDIVFFGELLPTRFHKLIDQDFPKCDLLIVMGTSLKVHPMASLIDKVDISVPRLFLNKTDLNIDSRSGDPFDKHLGMTEEEVKQLTTRDVMYIGDCDEGVKQLAEYLGWKNDLDALIDNANKQRAKL